MRDKHVQKATIILAKFRNALKSGSFIWKGIEEYETAFFLTETKVYNITVACGKDFVEYRVPLKRYVKFGVIIHNHAWKPHFTPEELHFDYLSIGESFLVEPSTRDIDTAASIKHFAHAVIDHRFNIMLFDHYGSYSFFHHNKPIVP